MSGEAHLLKLETMLDDATRRYQLEDLVGGFAAAYWHGQATGIARSMSLISRYSPEYELAESRHRIKHHPREVPA